VTGLQTQTARVEGIAKLFRFRRLFHKCLSARPDALFELTDAVLCAKGPITSLVQLSLCPVFRRGHGALYDALACGQVNKERLRDLLVEHLPADAPLLFALDGSTYPRPDAECSPEREHAYAPCRCDGARKTIPGWEFQWAVGLEWGTNSWTHPVDVIRPGPRSETALATAGQIRALVARLKQAGRAGGPDQPVPLMLMDSGFPAAQLTHLLADVPAQLLIRLTEDRVFFADPAPRRPGHSGRPGRHGERFELKAKVKLRRPDQLLVVPDSGRYGRVEVRAWHRLHQVFQRRGVFDPARYPAEQKLPIVRGTVIEVRVEHLPDGRVPHRVLWLWHSGPGPRAGYLLAGLPAQIRSGTHLPLWKVRAGLDLRARAYPRTGRALDLADPCCLHPAVPCPAPDWRSAPCLGTSARRRQGAQPAPSPARISQHPRSGGHPGLCAQTDPARSRSSQGQPERAGEAPSRRNEPSRNGHSGSWRRQTGRLNRKLKHGRNPSSSWVTDRGRFSDRRIGRDHTTSIGGPAGATPGDVLPGLAELQVAIHASTSARVLGQPRAEAGRAQSWHEICPVDL
jgi:hypothetical protein